MAELTIGNEKYMLSDFRTSFRQDINSKNQPDGWAHGGKMFITLAEKPDATLMECSMSSSTRYDGEIRFYSCSNKVETGALFTITFKGARCVSLYRKAQSNKSLNFTKLLLFPDTIIFGEEEL